MAIIVGDIVYRVRADTTGLKGAPTSIGRLTQTLSTAGNTLKKVEKSAKANTTALGKTTLAMQDLTKSVQIALGPLSGVAARITAFTALANKSTIIMAGLVASMIGFGVVIKKAVDYANSFDVEMRALEVRMASMGKQFTLTTEQLDELSKKFGRDTLGSASDARKAMTTLASATELTNKQFESALYLSRDLADAGFGGMQEQARRLAKILADPGARLDSLRRLGITFTDQEQKMIKVISDFGDKSSAVNIVLAKMEQKFAGVSESAAATLPGVLDTLRERITQFLQEAITSTNALEPLKQAIKNITAELVHFLNNKEDVRAFGETIKTILTGVAKSIEFVATHLKQIGIILAVMATPLGSVVMGILRLSGALLILKKVISTFTLLSRLSVLLIAVGIALVSIKTAIDRAKDAFPQLDDKLKIFEATFKGFFTGFWDEIKKPLEDFAKNVLGTVAEMLARIMDGIAKLMDWGSHLPKFGDKFKEGAEAARGFAESLRNIQFDMDKNVLKPIEQDMIPALRTYFNKAKKFVVEFGGDLKNNLGPAAQAFKENLSKYLSEFMNSDEVTKVLDYLTTKFNDFFDMQTTGMENVSKDAAKYADDLKKRFAEALNKAAIAEQINGIRDAFTKGFNSIGETIAKDLANGEIKMKEFGDIAKQVVADIVNTFLKLQVINPILNSLFSTGPLSGGYTPLPAGNMLTSLLGIGAAGVAKGGASTGLLGGTLGLLGSGASKIASFLGIGGGTAAAIIPGGMALTSGLTSAGAATGGATQFFATAAGGNTAAGGSSGIFNGLQGVTGASLLSGAATGFLGNSIANMVFGDTGTTGAIGGGIGGGIGFALGGPIGSGIGSFLGSALGGLFKNKNYPYARAGINIKGGQAYLGNTQQLDKGDVQAITQLANTAISQINDFFNVLGLAGTNLNLTKVIGSASGRSKALGKGYFAGSGPGGFAGGAQYTNIKTPEEAVNALVLSTIKDPKVLDKLDKSLAKLIKSASNADQLKAVVTQYMNVKNAIDSFNQENDKTVTVFDQLKAKFTELTAAAKQFGIATTDLNKAYVSALQELQTNLISNLRGLISQASQTLGINALQDFQNSLIFSNINPASPVDRFGQAKGLLSSITSAALGGDLNAIQQFPSVAQQVLQLGRETYASGAQYQSIYSEVTSNLNTILQQQLNLQESLLSGITITLQDTSEEQIAAIKDQTKAIVSELASVKAELRRRGA